MSVRNAALGAFFFPSGSSGSFLRESIMIDRGSDTLSPAYDYLPMGLAKFPEGIAVKCSGLFSSVLTGAIKVFR